MREVPLEVLLGPRKPLGCKSLLSISPNGTQTWLCVDNDGNLWKNVIYPSKPTLDRNAAFRNHNDGYSPDRSIQHVASVPLALETQWEHEIERKTGGQVSDEEKQAHIVGKLNDRDFSQIRTIDGYI